MSRLGPAVELRFHRRTAEQVSAMLVAAEFDLLWTCLRPPVERDGEATGQCYLLAACPV
ncbi:hypothetical protein [Kineosporia sp. A_224]|uniref:hypothetical protein n=1 Tax=Kineosporia sp. A_224 TaxID=1962180 RepID=UPI0018EA05C3|nr:hypothetical protein [Kineosporia sp. A_224]